MTIGIDLHADELREVVVSPKFPNGASAEERLLEKLEQRGDCLIWTGRTNSGDRGEIFFQGRLIQSHRAIWALRYGFLSKTDSVIHSCLNPRCCNPDHMFIGTQPDIAKHLVSVNEAHWQKFPEAQRERGFKYGFPKGHKPTHGFGSPLRNRNPSP